MTVALISIKQLLLIVRCSDLMFVMAELHLAVRELHCGLKPDISRKEESRETGTNEKIRGFSVCIV